MKKYIQGIALAAFFVITLTGAAQAHAAPQFVAGQSPYLPLVQVEDCNPTTGTGCSSNPYSYAPSVSNVQPGDNVWVMVYYNNQGVGTANNAIITLSPSSTGPVASQTFSGTLSAYNANSLSGAASVNLSQNETLTYVSAKLYAHNGVQIALPNGQTGQELFNGGLSIGNIQDPTNCPSSDSFCNQGVLVVTYSVGQTVTPPAQTCQITQLAANPSYVSSGNSSQINWSTSGCVSASLTGGNLSSGLLNGSLPTGALYGTTTYTLTAYGSSGIPVSQPVTVTVNQQQQQSCYINYFNANPTWVTYGGTSTLQWSTTGCYSVTLSGSGVYSGNQSLNGTYPTGAIYGTQTYTLYAYDQYGQSQQSTVTVTASGNNNYNYNYCSIGSFYASPTTVSSGSSTTLYWNTTGATSVYISGLNNGYNSYNQPLSGSASTGAIYGTQTYTLTAGCQYGSSQTQTITVGTNYIQPVVTATSVYTSAPSLVGQDSARLNGILTQSGGYNTNVYFEWGTTQSFGYTTNQQNAGSANGNPFLDTITGLSPNTTYYYQAVATNSSGTFYGGIQSFSTTPVAVAPTPTVITRVISSVGGTGTDLISLDINNNQQINACVGNMVNYTVNFKNISGHTLTNAVLQVTLPQDVSFQSANPGLYNAADHTVTLSLGTLTVDQQGTMNITGTVTQSQVNQNLIVASATLAFTNPSTNSQESATAYGLGNTTNCATNSLAGLALFGNGFWPTTLIGWLVLILILLLLLWLASLLYRNSRRSTTTNAYYGPVNNAAPRPAANPAPHYEDMDVPTYTGGH